MDRHHLTGTYMLTEIMLMLFLLFQIRYGGTGDSDAAIMDFITDGIIPLIIRDFMLAVILTIGTIGIMGTIIVIILIMGIIHITDGMAGLFTIAAVGFTEMITGLVALAVQV